MHNNSSDSHTSGSVYWYTHSTSSMEFFMISFNYIIVKETTRQNSDTSEMIWK